jgi:hypothetical protein
MPVFSILSRLPGVKGSLDMIRNVIAFTLITLPLATGISLGQEFRNTTATLAARSDASRVQVKELQPFTHLAQIPADSEKGTIRFEGAKIVQVPTRITYTMDMKAIASPSDYITVRVDPVSAMAGRVSTEEGLPPSVGRK